MNKIFYCISIAIPISGLFISCNRNSAPVEVIRPVKVAEVQPYNVMEFSYTGVVTPKELVNLAFRMGGPLTDLNVVEGANIKKGDVVAQMDPSDYRLDMEAKRATFITATQQMERAGRLIERNAISKQDYETITAQYENAKAAFENALSILEQTTLRAPFDGFVQQKYVENYQEVTSGQKIICLINPTALQMQATLPDRALSYITSDPEISVEFDAYKGKRFEAKITEYVQSSPDGSGVPIYVEISDPAFNLGKYRVAIGFSCTIHMAVEINGRSPSLLVPLSSVVVTEKGEKAVYLYLPETEAVEFKIIEGGEVVKKSYMVVTQGLSAGDKVVTAGAVRLKNGQRVRLLREQ